MTKSFLDASLWSAVQRRQISNALLKTFLQQSLKPAFVSTEAGFFFHMSVLRFFILAGPTAVGKSDFAVEIAERMRTEIVGADAFQVYKGFQILSGKPSTALQARVRHHLIDFLPVTENFDAARFAALAEKQIGELNQRGLVPLVVGGSGFYIDALLNPLRDLPTGDRTLRNRLATEPLDSLLAELKRCDPLAFAEIDRRNRRRIERAIEVIRLTGKPFSAYRRPRTNDSQVSGLVLSRPRPDLHLRIDQRVRWMLENGAIEEVRLAAPELSMTARQMIGVSEISRFLRKEISFEECVHLIQTATRQYARRQITWFNATPFRTFSAAGSAGDAAQFYHEKGPIVVSGKTASGQDKL
jgi:tRNA dimethylallyltransferase